MALQYQNQIVIVLWLDLAEKKVVVRMVEKATTRLGGW